MYSEPPDQQLNARFKESTYKLLVIAASKEHPDLREIKIATFQSYFEEQNYNILELLNSEISIVYVMANIGWCYLQVPVFHGAFYKRLLNIQSLNNLNKFKYASFFS